MGREHTDTLGRMRAVLGSRTLYDLAGSLTWERRVGRRPTNPTYAVLAFGVLARVSRSGVRMELDLAHPSTWTWAREQMIQAIAHHGLDLPEPGRRPPNWAHWRWLRDHHLATDEGLAQLARAFPPLAVACANRIGLLDKHGPGSLTHPDASRAVYGDGTLIRPMYKPPVTVTVTDDDGSTHLAYPDPRTGQLHDAPVGRFDPDLQMHHGQLGSAMTHGYVCWHTRGPALYQRVVLAAAHIPAPGAESATAVSLLGDVHRAAGTGIQVAIYDGAMRGAHIDQIMRRYGYLVLAKMATTSATDEVHGTTLVVTPTGKRARSYPLGTATHTVHGSTCPHLLGVVNGQVVELGLDDAGDPVVTSTPTRTAVKRSRRATGQHHFNVGYRLTCAHETFEVWLSPHPGKDGDTRRPENLRVIPQADADFQRLHGLRSDAESFHANLKRTLLVDRSMSLGWRRGLVDVYCFALLNNALTEQRAAQHERTTGTGRSRRTHLA